MSDYHYFDICFHASEEMQDQVFINEGVALLHGMPQMNNREIAIGFPRHNKDAIGSTIRVYAPEIESVKSLKNILRKELVFRDYATIGNIKTIRSSATDKWIAYCRFRIPSKASDRNNTQLHERRKDEAQSMPYVFVNSNSTKRSFMLRIKILSTEEPKEGFSPNAYGLGSVANPVWLPCG